MIYTSYHAMTAKLRKAGLVVVNISRYSPKFVPAGHQKNYLDLAPAGWMLKATPEVYAREFDKILGKLDPQKVVEDLAALGDGRDVAIVCYEKDRNECHRKTVAEWLEEKTGIEVPEYDFGSGKKKKPLPVQPMLF